VNTYSTGCKAEDKVTTVRTTKAHKGSRGTNLFILNLREWTCKRILLCSYRAYW